MMQSSLRTITFSPDQFRGETTLQKAISVVRRGPWFCILHSVASLLLR
jgi:hypothetical protein